MPKIMLVDDEPEFTYIVKLILEKEGYEAVEAHSGRECLERIREERPDLLLLDIMMPGMDGWEVCRRIKEDEGLRSIPVIMLTIKFQEDSKLKSFECGCDGYISKPINKEKLLKAVHWVLGEPLIDRRKAPSKCGIDCAICDQFIYEVCQGCLSEKADSCTITLCVGERGVATCLECQKIDYCKKRKETVDTCLVFNPAKESKRNFLYPIGEEDRDEGFALFTRAVVEGSKGLIFTDDPEDPPLTMEGVKVLKSGSLKGMSEEIRSFVKEGAEGVVLIESLGEEALKRPFQELLAFVEGLHRLTMEKSLGVILFVGSLEREERHQLLNFLTSLQIESIIRAVSNPQRKDILELLEKLGKSTFSEMLQALGYTNPSKLSFHLKVLKQVGILDQDNSGVYYLTETGRRLDELLYRMKESVSSVFSITPDFAVASGSNTVVKAKAEAYKRYIKSAEKAGLFKIVDILRDIEDSLSVFFGREEAERIIITAFDEYISSEKMPHDEGLKKKISEIAFVFLSGAMPLEDAIDWADKLLVKYSLKG